MDGRLHCVLELLCVDEVTGCVEHLDLSAQDLERCIRTLFYISVIMDEYAQACMMTKMPHPQTPCFGVQYATSTDP